MKWKIKYDKLDTVKSLTLLEKNLVLKYFKNLKIEIVLVVSTYHHNIFYPSKYYIGLFKFID